jgi:DNA-binding transcriptional regulator GbsR (MarR family)
MNYTDKLQFVDDFSLLLEETGRSRILGQILGWLLICEPAHQSVNDLMNNLDISKASVSNCTRILVENGTLEKVRITGERQIYFRLKSGSLTQFIEKQISEILNMHKIIESGLRLAESDTATDSNRLKRAFNYHSFLAKEIPDVLKKYSE